MWVWHPVTTTIFSYNERFNINRWKHIKTLGLSIAYWAKYYLTLKKYKIIASIIWDKD